MATVLMTDFYCAEIVGNKHDIDSINAMDFEEFGFSTIDPKLVAASYEANRFSAAIVRDLSGSAVGYIDYYGLHESKMAALIDGSFLESELSRGDILGVDDVVKSRKIYIGGMVIRRGSGAGRGRIAASLLHFGLKTVEERILSQVPFLEVYVSAYGRNAVGILRKMGFSEIAGAENRRDESSLYARVLTKDNIRAVLDVVDFDKITAARMHRGGRPVVYPGPGRGAFGAFSPASPST